MEKIIIESKSSVKKPLIPVRWILALLGIYASMLLFAQRASLSVTIVAMTSDKFTRAQHEHQQISTRNQTHECAAEQQGSHFTFLTQSSIFDQPQKVTTEPEFDWNEKLQGVILGSQFYLYLVVPTFAGRISDRYGGKWVAFAGAAGPCLLSVITPAATRAWGPGVLIAIRTLMGGFHGCIYPSMFALFARWFPVDERASANGGLTFGAGAGNAAMYLLAGWLCKTEMGWPLVFYVATALYIPWMVLWLYYCTNDPVENPRVSQVELEFIEARNPRPLKRKKVTTKWMAILTSIPVLCSLVTKLCGNFGFNLFTTKMPSYLYNVFGLDIFANGAFNAAALMAQALTSLAAAPLAAWIITRWKVRKLLVRKFFQSITMFGPALCCAMIPVWGCNADGVISMYIGVMLTYGCLTGGEWAIVSEYAPNSAGAVFGFANILAYSSGVVVPYLVGVLLDSAEDGHRSQWNLIYFITAGVYTFGGIIFLIFGTDQQQSWDRQAVGAADDIEDTIVPDVDADSLSTKMDDDEDDATVYYVPKELDLYPEAEKTNYDIKKST